MSQIFNVPKNDTYPVNITVAHATLANYPSGLSAFTKLWFYGKYSVQDLDSAAVFTKTLGAGITVTTAGSPTVDGVVQVILQPSDTSGIPVDTPISLYCSLKGYDGTNDYTIDPNIILVVAAQATSKVS